MKTNNEKQTSERKQSFGRKVWEGISYLIPGYNIIKAIKNKPLIQRNGESKLAYISRGSYYLVGGAVSNALFLSYLAMSLGSGNWTPHQYIEQRKAGSIAFGKNGLADYNGNGQVERWERLRFFEENGLENSIDSLLLNGSLRANSRKLEQAINTYKSRLED